MHFVFLKRFRVILSLLFFFLISFLFIDFTNSLSSSVIKGILFFQFVPSLIKFLSLASILSAGFIIVIVLTLFFGRVYCSLFCPLGTLQDITGFLSRKIKKRKKYKRIRAQNKLRYSILVLSIIFLATGSNILINILDPYSSFGKIVSNIFRPVVYGINNLCFNLLTKLNNYSLFPVEIKAFSWLAFAFSITLLSLVVYLSYKKGRQFCNTICPVGTFLGFLSRFSIFRIKLDTSACTSCGICGTNCKAGCIDTKLKTVDFSSCVGCFNCLTVCPENGVKFEKFWTGNEQNEINPVTPGKSRRNFLLIAVPAALGFFALCKKSFGQIVVTEKKPVIKKYPVTPPGSISIAHFTNNCTACHLCISACPTHVLSPSISEYGLAGLFQPTMDYHASFCNYECTVCGDICPTGAILPLLKEQKKLTQPGKSNFIKENCVVYTNETACGACSEHCPTKAVQMVFYKGSLLIPEVNNEICVGCGACEFACPTSPKSIYVDGNPVHLVAKKPKEEKVKIKIDGAEDFPF